MNKADQRDFDSHYEYWDKLGNKIKEGTINNSGQPEPEYMPCSTIKGRRNE